MDYSNILNALGVYNAMTSPTSDVAAENYRVFDELQRRGVRLKDLVDRAESPVDDRMFGRMEAEVSGVASVAEARTRMSIERERALNSLIAGVPMYSEAVKAYHKAVNDAYMGLTAAEENTQNPADGKTS